MDTSCEHTIESYNVDTFAFHLNDVLEDEESSVEGLRGFTDFFDERSEHVGLGRGETGLAHDVNDDESLSDIAAADVCFNKWEEMV